MGRHAREAAEAADMNWADDFIAAMHAPISASTFVPVTASIEHLNDLYDEHIAAVRRSTAAVAVLNQKLEEDPDEEIA